MTNKTKSFILLFLALAILNAIPTSTEARLYGRRRTKSIKQSYQEPTMGFMDEIDRHGVGSGIDWMNGCDRKKCPCGCEPCQSGLCRCYSWCRGDEMGNSDNFACLYSVGLRGSSATLPQLPSANSSATSSRLIKVFRDSSARRLPLRPTEYKQ